MPKLFHQFAGICVSFRCKIFCNNPKLIKISRCTHYDYKPEYEERYIIIYVWKILEGLVPNLTGRSQIVEKSTLRFGRTCVVPLIATAAKNRLQRLREGSFCVKGPNLFNSLPSHLRNMTGVSHPDFKKELDKFLWTVADEPLTCGYTARRRAESNSLQHMIPACRV